MINKKLILLSVISLFVLSSCKKQNRFEFDYKKDLLEVNIHRFDKALMQLDTTNLMSSVENIYQDYAPYLKLYVESLDTVSFHDTLAVANSLKAFVFHPIVSEINKTVLETFPSSDEVEKELGIAFTYLTHYFPGIQFPNIFFFTSGITTSFLYSKDLQTIGVGADFFLGSEFSLYQDYFYDYMLPLMTPENLTVDLLSAVLYNNFHYDSDKNRLLDDILYRGKIKYLLSVIMPEREEHEVLGFTREQANWANTNEKEAWKIVVSEKHLFSTDALLISKYVENAPFTAAISQDSPARMGEWLGFQIVKKYMNKNRDITLIDLMRQNDYQAILEKSGYNP